MDIFCTKVLKNHLDMSKLTILRWQFHILSNFEHWAPKHCFTHFLAYGGGKLGEKVHSSLSTVSAAGCSCPGLSIQSSDQGSYPADRSAGQLMERNAAETHFWSGKPRSSSGTHSDTKTNKQTFKSCSF